MTFPLPQLHEVGRAYSYGQAGDEQLRYSVQRGQVRFGFTFYRPAPDFSKPQAPSINRHSTEGYMPSPRLSRERYSPPVLRIVPRTLKAIEGPARTVNAHGALQPQLSGCWPGSTAALAAGVAAAVSASGTVCPALIAAG